MNNKIRLSSKTVFNILVFLVIYCSHDTLLFGTNADNRFILIRKAFPFFVIGCVLLVYRLFRIRKTALWKFLVVFLLPIVSCVMNGEDMNNYVYRAAIMAAALLLVLAEDQKVYYETYNKVMFLLSAWSIVTYLMMLLTPDILSRFPGVYNSGGILYRFTGLSTVSSELHYGMFRNSSIFREPGMLCVMLTFALINELTVLKTMRANYLVIYIIAIATTYSTAGYVIAALLFAYYMVKERRVKYQFLLFVLMAAALVVLGTQTNLLSLEGIIFNKFLQDSKGYGSWAARLSSITTSLLIALENPIWGIGRYSMYDVVLSRYTTFYQSVYQVVDNTNTIMIGFAAYGIPYGAMVAWGCWRFIRKRENSVFYALCLFAVLLMALSNEDMGQNIAFYYIVFDGLCANAPAQSVPVRNTDPGEEK